MPDTLQEITTSKLIIVEGVDAKWFWTWAYQAFGLSNILVLDAGGINELGRFLEYLPLFPNFEMVEAILVIRDAERDADAAMQSIRNGLARAELPAPERPFQFADHEDGSPRVAFALSCGTGTCVSECGGTLEDLCLSTVAADPVMPCVHRYLNDVQSSGEELRRLHKSRLYAYLAGKDKYVGKKLGEAASAGAWDWEHEVLRPYRDIMAQM